MKKQLISIISFVLCLSLCFGASASGFTQNADAIEQATKSVLKIYVFEKLGDDEPASTGSGFVAFSPLILITNYHVIDDAAEVYAADDDDNIYEIDKVLCADKDADIAILGFKDSSNLKPLDLYADDQLKRGSPVVAIGSPKGLKNTVSTGIVSAQYVEDGIPLIQTTAPISPGSSGGALLNDDGRVIGVTSSGYVTKDEFGEDTGAQNINFAVNIAVAQAMYKAWDGTKYTLSNHKSSAKMDFTGVYDHSAQAAAMETAVPQAAVETAAPQKSGAVDGESWTCINCGHENTTNFCLECGAEKPYWVCACGRANSSSKFCGDCGSNRDDLINSMNDALRKANDHDYAGAIEALEVLGAFDSGSFETSAGTHIVAKIYIAKQYYDQGVFLQSIDGDHDQIVECFTKAGDYADAKEQIQGENARYRKAFYDAGVAQLASGEYEAALESFIKAEDYKGAKEKVQEAYYQQGLSLLQSKEYDKALACFEKVTDYSDAGEKIKEVYFLQGMAALDAGNMDTAKALFEKAGDYQKAKDQIEEIDKENTYNIALAALNDGDYQKAEEVFAGIMDYRDVGVQLVNAQAADLKQKIGKINTDPATMSDEDVEKLKKLLNSDVDSEAEEIKELFNQIRYTIGIYYAGIKCYEVAISWLKDTGDYLDAPAKIMEYRDAKIQYLIDMGKMEDAIKYYDTHKESLVSAGIVNEYVVMEPGSQGKVVKELLSLLAQTGIKSKISAGEEIYSDAYISAVQEMEQHFGLNGDGKITLDEYKALAKVIYPGVESDRVKSLLEKLADLNYLSDLPEKHDVYEQKYVNGVKKAEKALGMQVDGIITNEEYDVIELLKADPPAAPAKINVKKKKATAEITWSKVPGAVCYEISFQGKVLGTTDKTKWVHKADIYTVVEYTVKAKKYTVDGTPKVWKGRPR